MSDTLRALLGDKYEATIEKVTDAIAGFNDYLGCGCCTAYGYNESVARTGEDERPRMAAHDALAAVLPDLLAERDALAAKLDAVRALAEHYAGLTNVDAGSAILRALDFTEATT